MPCLRSRSSVGNQLCIKRHSKNEREGGRALSHTNLVHGSIRMQDAVVGITKLKDARNCCSPNCLILTSMPRQGGAANFCACQGTVVATA